MDKRKLCASNSLKQYSYNKQKISILIIFTGAIFNQSIVRKLLRADLRLY